jgi:hypothetical protein
MSTPAAKALAGKKVRRQKQIIGVGSVVLLALVGFQLPKLLGGGGEDAAAPTVTATVSAPGTPAVTSATASLPDTGRVVIQRDAGQLVSFGLFKSKDPFVQQLSANAPAATTPSPSPIPSPSVPSLGPIAGGSTPATPTTTSSATPAPPTSSAPGPTETSEPAPGSPQTTPTATTPPAPSTTPAAVLLSINGLCESVAVNGTFPGSDDIFRLVAIAQDGKSVEIGVVGGSYDSGQPTANLKLGDKLTLVNTADGTRYVIALKTKCDIAPQPTGSSTPAPTTPIVPLPAPSTTTTTITSPAPTTTSTTPIVPDALDTTVPSG